MTGEKRSQFLWCNDFFGVQNSFGIYFCFQLGRSGSSSHGKSSTVLWAPRQWCFTLLRYINVLQRSSLNHQKRVPRILHTADINDTLTQSQDQRGQNMDDIWITDLDDIWTTNHGLKDNLQVLLNTLVLMSHTASHASDWWLQSGTRSMWSGYPHCPGLHADIPSTLSRAVAATCRRCEFRWWGDHVETTRRGRKTRARAFDWHQGWSTEVCDRQRAQDAVSCIQRQGENFPVGTSSSLPTQQGTSWNMWVYNELLWIETAGLFQNQKRPWKKLMLAMAVHANPGTQTLAGIVNLSYLSADIIVLIHQDLRLLEADRAIALHHGGSKPQRCHWFGAKRLATTMILTSNGQQNNIRFLEQLGKQWQQTPC